jgi:CheY-like chemotaxis protein
MRRYLRTILEPFVTVLEARDGQDALDTITSRPPDLILTDHMMPVLDGPGLIKAVREHPSELALCPLILITARTSPSIASSAPSQLTDFAFDLTAVSTRRR